MSHFRFSLVCSVCGVSCWPIVRDEIMYCNEHAPAMEIQCTRCEWDKVVPHDSCLYGGRIAGHSRAHCTANACF
jgi:hypothetical protein